jgi:hypothetical protein
MAKGEVLAQRLLEQEAAPRRIERAQKQQAHDTDKDVGNEIGGKGGFTI